MAVTQSVPLATDLAAYDSLPPRVREALRTTPADLRADLVLRAWAKLAHIEAAVGQPARIERFLKLLAQVAR